MEQQTTKGGIPRGLKRAGPVVFSYGFRPFFLGAATWAVVAMILWILSILSGLPVGGSYGAARWHAHEMLFGFAPAVLAGFLLTTVPNWTGRLPVAGLPLAGLFALWCAGRLALVAPDSFGLETAIAVDTLFLPLFALLCLQEIAAGRKWKDLKVVVALSVLAGANIAFHAMVLMGADAGAAERLALCAYLMLITLVGGRMVPSFTRSWLNQHGVMRFPSPYGRLDRLSMLLAGAALTCWIAMPLHPLTAFPAVAAAVLHCARLVRWRGWTVREPLVLGMHIAYAFLPLGFLGIGLAAMEHLPQLAILHLLSVGAMAGMMLAVIMRSTRGHAGKNTEGSIASGASLLLLAGAALLRPLVELLPDYHTPLSAAAGIAWILAFLLFLIEYAPLLLWTRRDPVVRRNH